MSSSKEGEMCVLCFYIRLFGGYSQSQSDVERLFPETFFDWATIPWGFDLSLIAPPYFC
ncbi:unnamed protein product, partial [Vitis vinifera]